MVLFLSKEERLVFNYGILSSRSKNVPDFLSYGFDTNPLGLVALGLLLACFGCLLLSNAFRAFNLAIVVFRCFLFLS